MMYAQDTTLIGDVDCDDQITNEDVSLILSWIAGYINDLPYGELCD